MGHRSENLKPSFIPFPQMLELIRHARTDPEKEEVLRKVSYDFYNRYSRPEYGQVFTPLRSAIRPILFYPFYMSLEPVAEELEGSGIPHRVMRRVVPHGPQTGIKTYYFSLTEDTPRIQQFLKEHIGSIPNARLRDPYLTVAS